jgi:thioredoxin reductase (NADPH)
MKRVTIYTKDHCPYCDKAKNFFRESNIPFEEKDVTHNPELLTEMLSKAQGRKTVPEIFFGTELIGGWDDLYEKVILKGNLLERLL